MRADGPDPSISGLFSSWLSLSGWLCRACVERAQSFAEGGGQALEDAVLDAGCPPRRANPDGDELPPLDAEAFAASLRERAESALRQTAALVNAEPHVCLAAVTRDQVRELFRELADEALAKAVEGRVESAEAARGENDARAWVKRYRRMLAGQGQWPPPADEARGDRTNGEEVSGHA
jgi:hypothetical protein